MIVDTDGMPYAGEPFAFTIRDAHERVTVQCYVDRHLVFNDECPDPPCHEVVTIPRGTRGSMLRIVATTARGARVEQELKIAEAGASSGGAASAAS
jgi:hypothetical protein